MAADRINVPKDKFSQTMRIDITPEAIDEPSPHAARTKTGSKKVVTKKFRKIGAKSPATKKKQKPSGGLPEDASDFHQLLQSVYDAALLTDMTGNILDANVRAEDFLLYSRDELRGMSVVDLISGAKQSMIAMIRESLVERFVLIEACYCSRKDNTYFAAEIAVNQLRLTDSEFLCFFVRDVTMRREAEEKLKTEHTAIINARSGIAITDLDGVVQYANPAVVGMWGYEGQTDLEGKDVKSFWQHSPGENGDPLKCLDDGADVWSTEVSATRRDGTDFEVQATASCIRDEEGNPTGMVFSFLDISDRKAAEQARSEADRHRVMLQSLGAACHHLGQPATVLLANLGIIQRKVPEENDDLRGLLGSCVDAAEALSEILHKLNAVNEYKTTPYLEDKTGDGEENRILEI